VKNEPITQTLARVADAQAALFRARRLGALPEGRFEKANGLLLSVQQTLCAVYGPEVREFVASGESDRPRRRAVEIEPSIVVDGKPGTTRAGPLFITEGQLCESDS
jgi:hypothetical protein